MDAITFRFLIGLTVSDTLDIRLMDIVATYLYGSLYKYIHKKILEGFTMPKAFCNEPRLAYFIKLQKSLYGLKQSSRMWYNRLNEYLLKRGFENDEI